MDSFHLWPLGARLPRSILFSFAIQPIILDACRRIGTAQSGTVDFQAFYFRDGVFAGVASAVSKFLSHFVTGFLFIGLDIVMDRTEVIPACPRSQCFSPSDFPGCVWWTSENFKLLRAAVGDATWCESTLSGRVSEAAALLTAIGKYQDSHGAFTSCNHAGLYRLLSSPLRVDRQTLTSSVSHSDVQWALVCSTRTGASPVSVLRVRRPLCRRARVRGQLGQSLGHGALVHSHLAIVRCLRFGGSLWMDTSASRPRRKFPGDRGFFVYAHSSMIEARAYSDLLTKELRSTGPCSQTSWPG